MRAYYNALQTLKEIFEADEFVNTVTSDGYISFDDWRKNIYPLVDIYITTSAFNENTTNVSRFNVDITCMDIRDYSKEEVNDKFWTNDNRHDTWNLTHAILKRGFSRAIKSYDLFSIESFTDAERIVFGKENGLDGWRMSWTVSVTDELNTCL